MGEHAFGVGVGGDDEVVRLFVWFFIGLAVVGLEVVVEGSLGGFVELFGVEGFVGWIWSWLDHIHFSLVALPSGSRLNEGWRLDAG